MAVWGCGVLRIFDPKGEGDVFAPECRPQMQGSIQEQSQMILLSRVVRKVDNAIHRINHYLGDSVVCFLNNRIHGIAIHLVDSII